MIRFNSFSQFLNDKENIIEAKATMCGRCGTKHVHPRDGGTCPALSKKSNLVIRRRNIAEDLRKWFSKTDPKGGWKRINSKGKPIGPCAKEPGEAKPKCMSNEKIASLSKKERAAAVAAKRRHDPNPERQGNPINVSNYGKGKISEDVLNEKNVPTNPTLWSKAKTLARSKFNVYPSAYANGWAAKWYKGKGGGWKSVNELADQNTQKISFKEFINVELAELTIRDAAGHKIKIKKVPIRMADGTLKMQNPGKSGSSGGGGDGGE